MDAKAYGQLHPFLSLQMRVQGGRHGLDNPQTSVCGALRVIFMGLRIANIDEQAIPEIRRDMPIKALDDLSTDGLIRPDHLPQVFGVELGSQCCGIHQITKQDSELAAFRLRWVRCGSWQRRMCVLLRRWLRQWGTGHRWCVRFPSPDQASSCLINDLRGREEDGVFEVFKAGLIQSKLPRQGPI